MCFSSDEIAIQKTMKFKKFKTMQFKKNYHFLIYYHNVVRFKGRVKRCVINKMKSLIINISQSKKEPLPAIEHNQYRCWKDVEKS